MPTMCDKCGEEHYAVYMTIEYKKLCGGCYDKGRPKGKLEPDDIPYRDRSC